MVAQSFPLSELGLAGRALWHASHRVELPVKARRDKALDAARMETCAAQVQAALRLKGRTTVLTLMR